MDTPYTVRYKPFFIHLVLQIIMGVVFIKVRLLLHNRFHSKAIKVDSVKLIDIWYQKPKFRRNEHQSCTGIHSQLGKSLPEETGN